MLIIYSPHDAVVDSQRTEEVFRERGAAEKQLVPLEGSDDPSNHVLAGDVLSPSTAGAVTDLIVDFVRRMK